MTIHIFNAIWPPGWCGQGRRRQAAGAGGDWPAASRPGSRVAAAVAKFARASRDSGALISTSPPTTVRNTTIRQSVRPVPTPAIGCARDGVGDRCGGVATTRKFSAVAIAVSLVMGSRPCERARGVELVLRQLTTHLCHGSTCTWPSGTQRPRHLPIRHLAGKATDGERKILCSCDVRKWYDADKSCPTRRALHQHALSLSLHSNGHSMRRCRSGPSIACIPPCLAVLRRWSASGTVGNANQGGMLGCYAAARGQMLEACLDNSRARGNRYDDG